MDASRQDWNAEEPGSSSLLPVQYLVKESRTATVEQQFEWEDVDERTPPDDFSPTLDLGTTSGCLLSSFGYFAPPGSVTDDVVPTVTQRGYNESRYSIHSCAASAASGKSGVSIVFTVRRRVSVRKVREKSRSPRVRIPSAIAMPSRMRKPPWKFGKVSNFRGDAEESSRNPYYPCLFWFICDTTCDLGNWKDHVNSHFCYEKFRAPADHFTAGSSSWPHGEIIYPIPRITRCTLCDNYVDQPDTEVLESWDNYLNHVLEHYRSYNSSGRKLKIQPDDTLKKYFFGNMILRPSTRPGLPDSQKSWEVYGFRKHYDTIVMKRRIRRNRKAVELLQPMLGEHTTTGNQENGTKTEKCAIPADLEGQIPTADRHTIKERLWNCFQLFLEDSVTLPIAWWPFSPPIRSRAGALADQQVQRTPPPPQNASQTADRLSPSQPPPDIGVNSSSISLASPNVSQITSPSPSTTPSGSALISDPATSSMECQPKSLYFLLCFDIIKLRWGFHSECRLRQVACLQNSTDQEVFTLFRKQYYGIAGKLRRALSLRTLARINFVRFEIYDIDHVDVMLSSTPELPPRANSGYVYVETTQQPPLGNRRLLQYFHRPTRGGSSRDFERIPRRVEGLFVTHGGTTSRELEWGLHFVEGLSFFGIMVVVVFGAFASIVVGVIVTWKRDAGTGAGWGALVAGVLAVFIACIALVGRVHFW